LGTLAAWVRCGLRRRCGGRRRCAGDAVELLQVLTDLLSDRLRVDQLIARRYTEQRNVLLAALQ